MFLSSWFFSDLSFCLSRLCERRRFKQRSLCNNCSLWHPRKYKCEKQNEGDLKEINAKLCLQNETAKIKNRKLNDVKNVCNCLCCLLQSFILSKIYIFGAVAEVQVVAGAFLLQGKAWFSFISDDSCRTPGHHNPVILYCRKRFWKEKKRKQK